MIIHPKLQTFTANPYGRDFVVGDVHGCVSALHRQLSALKFDYQHDRLFCTGDLVDRGRAPVFLVSALKDPEGANLDRIQMVKGWVDANGVARERIYDLAWSDMAGVRRRVGGTIPAVGDTVVRREASYTNTIGAPEL